MFVSEAGLTPTQKGNVAEAAITLAAVKLGIGVLKPVQEGLRYDLMFMQRRRDRRRRRIRPRSRPLLLPPRRPCCRPQGHPIAPRAGAKWAEGRDKMGLDV